MIFNFFKTVFFIGFFWVVLSCDEILFVEDLSGETVVLLAPLNNTELDTGEVIFSWESLESAVSYQLQLATPNFSIKYRDCLATCYL